MDWFLYDRDLRHERVKELNIYWKASWRYNAKQYYISMKVYTFTRAVKSQHIWNVTLMIKCYCFISIIVIIYISILKPTTTFRVAGRTLTSREKYISKVN